MKIFAYLAQNEWWEIPDSSLLRSGQPFFIPDFANAFCITPVLMARIGKLGKNIAGKYAERYVSEICIGAIAYASDLLSELRDKGLPYAPAFAFDKSLFIGKAFKPDDICEKELIVNSENELLTGDFDEVRPALETLSSRMTLKDGDLIIYHLAHMEVTPQIGQNFVIELKNDNNTELEKILDIHIR